MVQHKAIKIEIPLEFQPSKIKLYRFLKDVGRGCLLLLNDDGFPESVEPVSESRDVIADACPSYE